jgi:hypothetical protein
MDECADNSIWDRTSCILSYGGSTKDCAINYSLLIISITGCGVQLKRLRHNNHDAACVMRRDQPNEGSCTCSDSQQQETTFLSSSAATSSTATSSNKITTTRIAPTYLAATKSLFFSIAFQIGLCLVLHCAGISIVWCAALGWMLVGMRQQQMQQQQQPHIIHRDCISYEDCWLFPLVCDMAGILYYAVTAEPITTVAHACAIAMGAILFWLSSTMIPCLGQQQ